VIEDVGRTAGPPPSASTMPPPMIVPPSRPPHQGPRRPSAASLGPYSIVDNSPTDVVHRTREKQRRRARPPPSRDETATSDPTPDRAQLLASARRRRATRVDRPHADRDPPSRPTSPCITTCPSQQVGAAAAAAEAASDPTPDRARLLASARRGHATRTDRPHADGAPPSRPTSPCITTCPSQQVGAAAAAAAAASDPTPDRARLLASARRGHATRTDRPHADRDPPSRPTSLCITNP